MGERTQFGLELPSGAISFCAANRDSLESVLARAETYRRRFTYYRDTSEWADSLMSERDADACRDTLLLVRGDEAVGMIELVLEGAGTLTIALLVVVESARLAGIGRLAVEQLAQAIANARRLDAPHIDTLAIGVEAQNQAARAFWERLDFVETSYLGNGADRIVNFERWIRAAAGETAAL